MNRLCYVTAFYDIGRDNWLSFRRTFDTYLEHFKPYIDMMTKTDPALCEMIIFIDEKYFNTIQKLTEGVSNIILVQINKDFMDTQIPIWKTLEKEGEIMQSDMYKNLIANRIQFPEHNDPKYTLINHAKIDFVNIAITMRPDFEYFCWTDFGYFQGDKNRIPQNTLDISLFDSKTVNYTLINPLDDNDKDVIYTLSIAPERIGGFFFFGHKDILKVYQKLYHHVHAELQKNNIVDDDQHIALRCYYQAPELFTLHYLGGWHKALVAFQKSDKFSIVVTVNDINCFTQHTIIFLTRFLNLNNLEDLYVLIPEEHLQYIEEYRKLTELPIKYVNQRNHNCFTLSFLIKTKTYLIMDETCLIKKSLNYNDLHKKEKIVCTLEPFPHGVLNYTTTRHDWYNAYHSLGLQINENIYESKCMTNSPQILLTNVVRKIIAEYKHCFLAMYWFYLQKNNMTQLYVETNVLWNRELSQNAIHTTVPCEYLESNIRNGCTNESKFIIVKGSFYELYKNIPILPSDAHDILEELKIYKTGFNFIRFGENRDGGYVICDIPSDILYSYGVGTTYKFENDFVETYKSKIAYLYDHTVNIDIKNPKIKHIKLGIDYFTHSTFNTIEDQIKNNGDWNNTDLTLKIDVEGYEWLSLLFMSVDCLKHFKQIIIELHWLDTDMNGSAKQKIAALRKINNFYALAHIHPVNCQNLVCMGSFYLPPVVECTFVRKDICKEIILDNTPVLPCSLDMPMDMALREISLSQFYPWNGGC